MAYDAVLRNLAVVGEAVKALPDNFKHEREGIRGPQLLVCATWLFMSTSRSTRR